MNTKAESLLDVTLLDPREKHPTIFKRFDELEEGETLVIFNDHDPKPLYYQLLNERGPVFHWQYLEEGPEHWRVSMTKVTKDEANATVGQLVAADYRKAAVFSKYGIDYCCGGKKTVGEVCKEKGIEVTSLLRDLKAPDATSHQRQLQFHEWKLDFLVDYIINTHHSFVKKNLPAIRDLSSKVTVVHAAGHPELLKMNKMVEELYSELFSHLEKEEQILFPYVKKLAQGHYAASYFGSIQNPIGVMETEHDQAGELLLAIRELCNDYTLPDGACTSYHLLFQMLKDFESDLHTHVHLENNILFPKAIQLEEERRKN